MALYPQIITLRVGTIIFSCKENRGSGAALEGGPLATVRVLYLSFLAGALTASRLQLREILGPAGPGRLLPQHRPGPVHPPHRHTFAQHPVWDEHPGMWR